MSTKAGTLGVSARPARFTLWTAAVSAVAFVFALGAIAGAGPDIVYWGFLLLLSGLPVYTWVVRQRRAAPSA